MRIQHSNPFLDHQQIIHT